MHATEASGEETSERSSANIDGDRDVRTDSLQARFARASEWSLQLGPRMVVPRF